jgi:hypothetical protein
MSKIVTRAFVCGPMTQQMSLSVFTGTTKAASDTGLQTGPSVEPYPG